MKLYLFFALSLGIYAYAELPTTNADNKTRETTEYLDGKVDKIQTGINDIVNASGTINMGWERNTTNCGVTASCVSVCSSGKKILGGGVDSPNRTNLGGSFPSADDRMFCYSDTNNITLYCYSICAKVQ